ncbi:MAG: hypothetical protein V7686_04545 [Qipengyuania sp.]
MSEPQTLTERLVAASECWTATCDATLARLGKVVANDTAFFTNLAKMRRGPSTDTLEKFARYLADPANWPGGLVAEEARALAHVVGVTPAGGAVSPGKTEGISPAADRGGAVVGGSAEKAA